MNKKTTISNTNNQSSTLTNIQSLKPVQLLPSQPDVKLIKMSLTENEAKINPVLDICIDDNELELSQCAEPLKKAKRVSWKENLIEETYFLKEEAPVRINMSVEEVERVQKKIEEEMLRIKNSNISSLTPGPGNSGSFFNFQSRQGINSLLNTIKSEELLMFRNSKDYS